MALTSAEMALCNLALLRTGQGIVIASVSEDTNARVFAETMYPYARDYVLSEGVWDFAIKRASLSSPGATDVANWANKYTLPSDSLRVLRVLNAAGGTRIDEPIPFQVIGSFIYCNQSTASVEYVYKNTTTTDFHPQFITALGYYLASELAIPMGAGPDVAKANLDAYMAILKQLQQQPYQHEPETKKSRNTSSTVSEVSICNMALSKIGFPRMIAALTDNTDEARACDQFYERARDMLLQEFPWQFAMKRAALSTTSGTPPTHWGFKYALPVDFFSAREIENPVMQYPANKQRIPFEVSFDGTNMVLYCNIETPTLVYTEKVTTVTRYTPHFVDALATRLAIELVLPLKLDQRLQQTLYPLFMRAMAEAEIREFSQGHDGPEPESEFLTSRNGANVNYRYTASGYVAYADSLASPLPGE